MRIFLNCVFWAVALVLAALALTGLLLFLAACLAVAASAAVLLGVIFLLAVVCCIPVVWWCVSFETYSNSLFVRVAKAKKPERN